jgi:peptide/nickel transport system substrate-binding protein
MQEHQLRALIERVRQGELPRRRFIQQLAGLGLSAPMASLLLMHEGIAQTVPPMPYKPTRRGGGGTLKLLWWQAPALLNPHLGIGTKDWSAGRIFYEPLAGWDGDGRMVPMLAAEIPTRQNGGIAADGKSVVWKLKRGVSWHDGKPFTADDVVFTHRYVADPATGAHTGAAWRAFRVEKVDAHTVRVSASDPWPLLPTWGVGNFGWMLPQHVFEPFIGARSGENPANVRPVGTGPYKWVAFRPGDMLHAAANLQYHVPHQPFFDALELKGGGEAVTAARTVLQTGDYDFAWGLNAVEDELLRRLEAGGKGRVAVDQGGDVECISLNAADPWTEVEGERAHLKSRHPAFSDKAVRTAMGLLVDRKGIVDVVVGRAGVATANVLNSPASLRSPNMSFEFNIDKANQVLEDAGWKKGTDGVRAKAGTKLKLVFQTASGQVRQKVQAIVKSACSKAGIDLELKPVTPVVFFGSDVSNPDTWQKFWADMILHADLMTLPEPQQILAIHRTDRIPQKANKWIGANRQRWQNAEYDALHNALEREFDPVKRAALAIQMNDLVVSDGYVIPLYIRSRMSGVGNKLEPVLSVWDNELWALGYWTRGS